MMNSVLTLPPSQTLTHLLPDQIIMARRQKSRRTSIKPSDYWQPQEKQELLLLACGLEDALHGGPVHPSITRLIGYGGAAFGGKTEGLLGVGLIACMMIPGVQIGLFRRTFAELEGSDGPVTRSMMLYNQVEGATYNQSKHTWKFPNGSSLRFCHCQNEIDVFNYQSQAFDILMMDEATHFSWFITDYLLTRNRPSKSSAIQRPFAIMTTNPGGVGHMWYMQLFDTDSSLGQHYTIKTVNNPNGKPEQSFFIPAFLDDNPLGVARDPDYEANLMKRDEQVAQALRYGDWSVFAGQALRVFSKQKHVIRPFDIPDYWIHGRCVDWGFADPWAVLWYAINPDNLRRIYYKEIYKTGITDPLQARMINEYSDPNITYVYNYADPSMWRRISSAEQVTSTYDIYLQHGILLTKGDNDAVNKLRKSQAILRDIHDGQPGALITEACPNLIRTLPSLVTDIKNREKIAEGQEEHIWDAFAYGLTNWTDPMAAVNNRNHRKKTKQENPWMKEGLI